MTMTFCIYLTTHPGEMFRKEIHCGWPNSKMSSVMSLKLDSDDICFENNWMLS